MASRQLGPDPEENPRNIGIDMRQGGDPEYKLPHGLQSSMKQGSTPDGMPLPHGLGASMKQGPATKSKK